MDILFKIVVPREEFIKIESMADFIRIMEESLGPIIDIENTGKYEILFVEKIDNDFSYIVHSRDRTSFDL